MLGTVKSVCLLYALPSFQDLFMTLLIVKFCILILNHKKANILILIIINNNICLLWLWSTMEFNIIYFTQHTSKTFTIIIKFSRVYGKVLVLLKLILLVSPYLLKSEMQISEFQGLKRASRAIISFSHLSQTNASDCIFPTTIRC